MKYENKTVKSLLHIDGQYTDHQGIEIETEGNNLPYVDTKVWKSEADGSLRGESYE